MNKINLTTFKVRKPANLRDEFVTRIEKCGVNIHECNLKAGVNNLAEIAPILEEAKSYGLQIELPEVPLQFVRTGRFCTERIRMFEKHDAVNLAVMAFSEQGLTGGLAACFSARDLTQMLLAFKCN